VPDGPFSPLGDKYRRVLSSREVAPQNKKTSRRGPLPSRRNGYYRSKDRPSPSKSMQAALDWGTTQLGQETRLKGTAHIGKKVPSSLFLNRLSPP